MRIRNEDRDEWVGVAGSGGRGRNTDSRQTKAFQAPACVAGSVLEMFQPAVLAVLSPQSGGRYMDV